jgi:membrane protease YdiL (CAAX protease family)
MKQLITFFGLAYLISWMIWLPLYGEALGLTNLPILPYNHGLGGIGPLISAFLTTWIYQKQKGVKLLIKKCFQVKPLIYLIVALFSPFLILLLAAIIGYFVDHSPIDISSILISKEFPQFNLLTFFIYNLLLFGFGEKVGWRGFALPRLQQKFSALTSSIILTIFWAIWHLPLFFYKPGFTSMDITGIFGWTFSLLTGSILLTWLYNSSEASILVCAVFHSTVNIAFTADFVNENYVNYMGMLITIWAILTIIIFKPKYLATFERAKDIGK